MFKDTITVLGNSAALPVRDRKLSAHLLETDRHSLLFDCGEGTQFQLFNLKKKIQRISKIFITHLHGDHFFGLPGLLSTMYMLGRQKPIDIYGPEGIEGYLTQLNKICSTEFKFEINFHIIKVESKELIMENDNYSIYAFPLIHRKETYGYLYEQKDMKPNIKKSFVRENEIPVEWFARIKNGEDYIDEDGKVFLNNEITELRRAPKSYAFCTDTIFMPQLIDYVKDVTILYHEATFLSINKKEATAKKHSTATDAANIAKEANVGTLIIGHFSARYSNLSLFEDEAKEIFKNTIIAEEGLHIEL